MDLNAFSSLDFWKANDCTSDQINQWWADIQGPSGYLSIIRPHIPKPILLVGGKGSGKTHLLRYISLDSSSKRHSQDLSNILSAGYIGIFVKCSGLNLSRFNHAEISKTEERQWDELFHSYFDLWLTASLLDQVSRYLKLGEVQFEDASKASRDLRDAFNLQDDSIEFQCIFDIENVLSEIKKNLELSVNQWPYTKKHTHIPLTSRGRLLTAIPRVLSYAIPKFKGVSLCYIIDEVENLTIRQQKYLQTLIRDREEPITYRIGARRYGIKTHETFSDGEINRRGSEFDEIYLDDHYRSSASYDKFIGAVFSTRISATNFNKNISEIESRLKINISDRHQEDVLQSLRKSKSLLEIPWFNKIKLIFEQLNGKATVDFVESQLEKILKEIQSPDDIFRELAIAHKFNHEFKKTGDFEKSIKAAKGLLVVEKELNSILSHYKVDLFARAMKLSRQKQKFIGKNLYLPLSLSQLALLSQGLPRVAIVILNNILKSAAFNGEDISNQENSISAESQLNGLLQTSKWFYEDYPIGLPKPESTRQSIELMLQLFSKYFYSDCHSECSSIAFTLNDSHLSEEAYNNINSAIDGMLLIDLEKRIDKNKRNKKRRFQINPILCPLYELPLNNRGTIDNIPTELIELIFMDNKNEVEIVRLTDEYIGQYNVSISQARPTLPKSNGSGEQLTIF